MPPADPSPSSSRRSAPSTAGRRAASTMGAALFVLLATLALAGPLAAGAQTPGATTAPGGATATTTITTTDDLLVGSTTVAPTTAPSTTINQAKSDKQAQSNADADTRRVWYIVAALLAVAFLLLLLTIVYWRHTRPVAPVRVAPPPAKAAADEPATKATKTDTVVDDLDPPKGRRARPKGGHGKHSAQNR